jgi:hypothetical protein
LSGKPVLTEAPGCPHWDGAATAWHAAENTASLSIGLEKERDMPKHHHDRPPGALAHGPTTSSDIERVRRAIAHAEQRVTRHLTTALAREMYIAAADPMTGQRRGSRTTAASRAQEAADPYGEIA